MNKAFLIFPHQLFEANFNMLQKYIYVLVEDELYFDQYNFHAKKLILHRASMQYYKSQLMKKNKDLLYFDRKSFKNLTQLVDKLKNHNITEVHYREINDDWLEQRLKSALSVEKIKFVELPSPQFLTDNKTIHQLLGEQNHLSMATFYIAQRKRLNLLLDANQKPLGKKWSLDSENRSKLPKSVLVPKIFIPNTNKYIAEATDYVKANFPNAMGSAIQFEYAVTHADAANCLDNFVNNRLALFGNYEDAIDEQQKVLFHSVLSPYLNIGLLTPSQVLDAVMLRSNEIPLNSLEGFVRQMIGWREFMRGTYILKGRKIRTSNFWHFKRTIPSSFYSGTTGIKPLDVVIQSINKSSYAHHIERLMVLGNFMLLCEFDPNDVYQWFMEMFIDAYDWVMVPNVYSMSQYACGGLITTKPYLSGSSYILKMSNYAKENSWCSIWDGLYWRFVNEHKEFFRTNPRLGVMASMVDKMDASKLRLHYHKSEQFLSKLK